MSSNAALGAVALAALVVASDGQQGTSRGSSSGEESQSTSSAPPTEQTSGPVIEPEPEPEPDPTTDSTGDSGAVENTQAESNQQASGSEGEDTERNIPEEELLDPNDPISMGPGSSHGPVLEVPYNGPPGPDDPYSPLPGGPPGPDEFSSETDDEQQTDTSELEPEPEPTPEPEPQPDPQPAPNPVIEPEPEPDPTPEPSIPEDEFVDPNDPIRLDPVVPGGVIE